VLLLEDLKPVFVTRQVGQVDCFLSQVITIHEQADDHFLVGRHKPARKICRSFGW